MRPGRSPSSSRETGVLAQHVQQRSAVVDRDFAFFAVDPHVHERRFGFGLSVSARAAGQQRGGSHHTAHSDGGADEVRRSTWKRS